MSRDVIVYVTKKDSEQRLSKQETKQFRQDIHQQEDRLLIVHPRETFQRILEFGGAVTEAAGYTWQRLGEKNKKRYWKLILEKKESAITSAGRLFKAVILQWKITVM